MCYGKSYAQSFSEGQNSERSESENQRKKKHVLERSTRLSKRSMDGRPLVKWWDDLRKKPYNVWLLKAVERALLFSLA